MRVPARSTPSVVGVLIVFSLGLAGCERAPGPPATAPSGSAGATATANNPSAAKAAAPALPAASAPVAPASAPATPGGRRFVVYYFHRTIRCATCLSIEKQAREAVQSAYSGELAAGHLDWQAVNFEAPGNEHFEKDFELDVQSLVLAELDDARVVRWKLLPRIWELVESPTEFHEYVVTSVAEFIGT